MNCNSSAEEYDSGITACQWVKAKCLGICAFLSSENFLISIITMVSLVSSLSLVTVAIAMIVAYVKYESFLGITFLMLPVFVIITGSIVLCTAVLGWYAVRSDKYNLFSAYYGLLVAILLFEILISVLAFELNGDTGKDKIINHVMYDSKMNYYKNSHNYYYYYADWDYLQSELQCCGYDDVNDWGDQIPLSCCSMSWRGPTFACTVNEVYPSGCKWKLNWLLADYTFVLGVTASAVTSAQGLIIVVAAWIAYRMKYQQDISYKGLVESTDHSQYHSVPGETI